MSWHSLTKRFPKIERYSLGQKTFDLLIEIITDVSRAEYYISDQKRATLQKANHTLDIVKILVRLSHTLELIDERTYIRCEEVLQEIGRMLGGWIRSLPTQGIPVTRGNPSAVAP